jgi:nucleoside-diphosphate-sugar epimerase
MKILLSGGSGFIGRNLISFLDRNYSEYKILSISRNLQQEKSNRVFFLKLDLNNIQKEFDIIKKFNPDVFLHLAWEGIPDYSEEISKRNYVNTLKIIDLIINNTSCKKIISTGSCWEYNDGNLSGKCDEDMLVEPTKSFSIYKNRIYQDVMKISKKKKLVFNWLRLFYVYGLHQKKGSIIPSLINSIRNNSNNININFPFNKNDFIYIDDVVKIIVQFIFSCKPSGIYNIGTGISTSIYDLFKIIDYEINYNNKLSTQYFNQIDLSKVNQNFYASTIKLKKYINKLDFVDIKSGIKKLLPSN